MKKRLLLTGSTSYLGTKFIELYTEEFDIMGLARSDPDHPTDLLDFERVHEHFSDFQPDFILHLAADIGRDYASTLDITKNIPAITQYLLSLASRANTPFIFTSTEAVYGGKESVGGYVETDKLKPRNPYGEAKVASERLIQESGLPYLITRGHRYVGINKAFQKPKQFPDTLRTLMNDREVHLDSQKIFTPFFINNACDILAHHINHEADRQVIMNIGIDQPITYFDFIVDVARELDIDSSLIKSDGEEMGWPQNSSLSVQKLKDSGYPCVSYEQMLRIIKDGHLV